MFRIHRLGHIEAKSLELVLPDKVLRSAKQSYHYLSVGFAAEIEKEFGITVEGISTVQEVTSIETCVTRLLIT